MSGGSRDKSWLSVVTIARIELPALPGLLIALPRFQFESVNPGPGVHQLFTVDAPRVVGARKQALDEDVPEKVTPIGVWVEIDDLNRFPAVARLVQ